MQLKRNWLLYLLAAAAAIFFAVIAIEENGLLDVVRLKRELAKLENENTLLKKENAELRRTAYRLMHDPEYLESIAREELGMVGKDEIIYRFVDESPAKTDK